MVQTKHSSVLVSSKPAHSNGNVVVFKLIVDDHTIMKSVPIINVYEMDITEV